MAAATNIDWSTALAQHDRWLRTIAYARLRDPDAVAEVLHEVACAAVRQAAPLADPDKVAPWLYRLTVRQVLLYRRGHGRRRKLASGYAELCRPSEQDWRTPDPLSWLIDAERRELVRQALEALPPRDAEILLLKYTEGWRYNELARHLGVSQSAVESRLHQARRRLREALVALEVIDSQV